MGVFKNIAIEQMEDPLYQQQQQAIAEMEMEREALIDFISNLKRNDVVDVFTTKDTFRHQGAIVAVQTNLDACKTRGARIYLKTDKDSYEYHWVDEITDIKKPKHHTHYWFC